MEDDHNRPVRFWGTHDHTLDAKGRIILPARFREPFRAGGFLAKGGDGCLALWRPADFDKRTNEMLENASRGQIERSVARSWAATSFEIVPDNQGRVAIPGLLRDFAELDGDVVINGAIHHVELWNARRWREIDAAGSQGLLSGQDALAEMGF